MHKSNVFSCTGTTTSWLTGFLTGDSPCSTTAVSGRWATASWASSSSSSSLWATMLWSGPYIWRSSWWILHDVYGCPCSQLDLVWKPTDVCNDVASPPGWSPEQEEEREEEKTKQQGSRGAEDHGAREKWEVSHSLKCPCNISSRYLRSLNLVQSPGLVF